VIEECFLLLVDARSGLILIYARWFDRDRVRTGVLPKKQPRPKAFRWVHKKNESTSVRVTLSYQVK
jgi:hypothetical protein